MFVAAIVAGATSSGVDVHPWSAWFRPRPWRTSPRRGISRPALWFPPRTTRPRDNGLKVADSAALKLDEEVEDELEQLIWQARGDPAAPADALGRAIYAHDLLDLYFDHSAGAGAPDSRRICTWWWTAPTVRAAWRAERILAETGAGLKSSFDDPDGSNINAGWRSHRPGRVGRRGP